MEENKKLNFLRGKRVQDECHHGEPALQCCKAKNLPRQTEQRFIEHHFKYLCVCRKVTTLHNKINRWISLHHSWISGPVIDLFEPNCPLLPTTGPGSCSRCPAWAVSDSRWGLGPRCNCGSDFPCWINVLVTGLTDIKIWPRLQPVGPSSMPCVWSHNLKCEKHQHNC